MNRITNQRSHKIPMFLIVLLLLCVLLIYCTGVISNHSTGEQMKVLSDAVERSIVQCYALEGEYPTDIDYLQKNYGLSYDESKFTINYSYVDSRTMPEVDIAVKED